MGCRAASFGAPSPAGMCPTDPAIGGTRGAAAGECFGALADSVSAGGLIRR